ncbi:MAG: biopolymer transporter ExbD [Chitinophagales bacterium]
MAEITNNSASDSKVKDRKPRSRKLPVRVDMTPMVDLGFLLIAFFMLTTALDKPRKIDLDRRISEQKDPVGECQVLNILIDSSNHIFTYEGTDLSAMVSTSFHTSSGIRQVIFNKAKQVKMQCGKNKLGEQRPMVCLIKILPGAHYQSMINILDEMAITETATYSLQEPLPEELIQLQKPALLAENNR